MSSSGYHHFESDSDEEGVHLKKLVFLVGDALTDPNVEPVVLFIDQGIEDRLAECDPLVWIGVLGYVESELRNRS